MHPNNPMTEGEALAVEAGHWDYREIRSGLHPNLWPQLDAMVAAMIAAIAAHTAASGGEVVAWRKRATSVSTGEFFGETPWYDGLPKAADLAQVENANSRGVAHCWIEYAYRTPPAAVPADALERLVKGWERMALTANLTEGERAMLRNRKYELAALIPKGADHEQR